METGKQGILGNKQDRALRLSWISKICYFLGKHIESGGQHDILRFYLWKRSFWLHSGEWKFYGRHVNSQVQFPCLGQYLLWLHHSVLLVPTIFYILLSFIGSAVQWLSCLWAIYSLMSQVAWYTWPPILHSWMWSYYLSIFHEVSSGRYLGNRYLALTHSIWLVLCLGPGVQVEWDRSSLSFMEVAV